jgi:hypothetical protein
VLTISGSDIMPDYSAASRPPWYTYRTEIKSAVIGNSVTTIEYLAFNICGLTSVTIPNSVTSYGKTAASDYYSQTHRYRDSRQFWITATYQIANYKVKRKMRQIDEGDEY